MKTIVCKKKPQSDSLQHQENDNGKKTPDEEEYITHLYKEHGTRNKIQDETFAKDLSPVETLVSCTFSFISLQMDTCHNVSKQYPYHEQHFSVDHRQHAREV